jgi:hypothetical protein
MLWAIGTTTIGWDALVFWAWGSEDWLAKTTEFAAQGASAVPCGEYGGGPRSNWPAQRRARFAPLRHISRPTRQPTQLLVRGFQNEKRMPSSATRNPASITCARGSECSSRIGLVLFTCV